MSERLQEARAACEATERRLDDATSQNTELRRSVGELEKDLSTQGAELAKMKAEIMGLLAVHEETLSARAQADIAAARRLHTVGAASASVGLIAGIALRIIFDRPVVRSESDSD